jgi:hypothetical protein
MVTAAGAVREGTRHGLYISLLSSESQLYKRFISEPIQTEYIEWVRILRKRARTVTRNAKAAHRLRVVPMPGKCRKKL